MLPCATVVLIASLGVALAQDYELTWVTIGGGADMSSSTGEYEATGTAGQPDAGVMSGGTYTATGGFLPGVVIPGDCDGDGDVDLDDFAGLDLCLAGPGGGLAAGCGCLDFDSDNDVDLGDFAGFEVVFTGSLP
jgi:hypothetical protein